MAQDDPVLAAGDDPEYEVGAVIDHRDGVGGQREYRVAWAGFPDEEEDTWEPWQNLTLNLYLLNLNLLNLYAELVELVGGGAYTSDSSAPAA